MSVIQRLLTLLNEKSLKMSDLCAYIGINASTMTTWKTRNTDPPAKHLIRICEFTGVSLEYLLTGEEKEKISPSLAEDEQELLATYQKLGRRGKAKTLATAYDELDLIESNK